MKAGFSCGKTLAVYLQNAADFVAHWPLKTAAGKLNR